MKIGDIVTTIYGVARIKYIRNQTGGVVYETTLGNFSKSEIEVSMTSKDWERLSELLLKVVGQDLPTWQEKLEELRNNVDNCALDEIAGWLLSEE